MSNPIKSSVTDVTLNGVSLTRAVITPASAGHAIEIVGGNPKTPSVNYLYGPGLTLPDDARLPTLALPASLPPGHYTFKSRRQGETEYTTLTFTVAASVGSSTGQPNDENSPPAHTIDEGIVGLLTVHHDTAVTSGSGLWQGTKTALEVMRAVGIVMAREWSGFIGNVSHDVAALPGWDSFKPYIDAGVLTSIIVCLASGDLSASALPTAAATNASALAIVAKLPAFIRPLLAFEIGNEEGMHGGKTTYWPGTLQQYADQFYNPAARVFTKAGIKTILGGLNGWAPGDLVTLLADHIDLSATTAIGYHPYAEDAAAYQSKTSALVALTDKLIIETESNTKDGPDYLAWLRWQAAGANGPIVGKSTEAVYANQQAVHAKRLTFPAIVARAEFSLQYQEMSMTGPLGWFKISTQNGVKVATTTPLFDRKFADKFQAVA